MDGTKAHKPPACVCIPPHRTGPQVLAFLQRQLPQCDIPRMVSPQEATRFARSPGGFFPRPQYALEAQQVLGGGAGGVVLLVNQRSLFLLYGDDTTPF